MNSNDFAESLGLNLFLISFDGSASFLSLEEISRIPEDMKTLTKIKPVPRDANHAYVTAYGTYNQNGAKISEYDIMYKRREGPNGRSWDTDIFIEKHEKVKVKRNP